MFAKNRGIEKNRFISCRIGGTEAAGAIQKLAWRLSVLLYAELSSSLKYFADRRISLDDKY